MHTPFLTSDLRIWATTLSLLMPSLACHKPTGGATVQPVDLPGATGTGRALYAPSDERATYFAAKDQPLRYCAEPMPDTASDRATTTTVEGTHKGAVEFGNDAVAVKVDSENSLKAGRELKITSKEMAGRNPTVLLAREMMYRLCEVGLNFDPGSKQYENVIKNYGDVLDVIKTIADTEKTKADTAKAKADTDLAEITLKANEQVGTVVQYVSRVVMAVTEIKDGKCVVNVDKLRAALKDPEFDDAREAWVSVTDCAALQSRLSYQHPEVLRRMAEAATPKPTAPTPPKK
jgi:hypothetical protein